MGTTEKFAQFIIETDFDDLPEEAVSVAKRLFLDTVGVTFTGAREPISEIVTRFTRTIGGTPEARLLGNGFRTSAPNAAFANSAMAHILDYDDTTFIPVSHPSCTIVPAILALGEKLHLSGRELIEAYVIALEVHMKFGAVTNLATHYDNGLNPAHYLGSLGVTAAAAKLLKLNVKETQLAIGIISSAAAGIFATTFTMAKSYGSANAAHNGIVAAMLAKEGLQADEDIIEKPGGMADMYFGKGHYDLAKMTSNLGNPFAILRPGIAVKMYPSCYGNQWVIGTLRQVLEEHHVTYPEIESVEVKIPILADFLNRPRPKDGLEGKFSLQYNLGAVILYGNVGIDTFHDEKFADPRLGEAMGKIKLANYPRGTPERETYRYPVTVTLKNGKQYSNQVDYPRGHQRNPVTQEELLAKYQSCAALVLPPAQVKKSISLMLNLEKLEDTTKLVDTLVV